MSIFTQSLIDGLCLPLLRVCYPCKTFLVSLLTRDSEARLTAAFAAGRDADDAHKPYHIIMSGFEASAACAEMMDRIDPLAQFRHRFQIPTVEGRQQVYFLGNSLGLQPVTVRQQVDRILGQWSQLGVEAFFHADLPWMELPSLSYPVLSKIIGCLPTELTVMSQLTVNLHLLMASFYQPKAHRYKILCEAKAFPSDQYMMASQVRLHGYDPNQAIIEVSPPPGEHCIREQDILEAIDQHADSLALIFWGGVNYYTGQVFDMAAIAHAAHQAGARVGFDLAHAAGNIPRHYTTGTSTSPRGAITNTSMVVPAPWQGRMSTNATMLKPRPLDSTDGGEMTRRPVLRWLKRTNLPRRQRPGR